MPKDAYKNRTKYDTKHMPYHDGAGGNLPAVGDGPPTADGAGKPTAAPNKNGAMTSGFGNRQKNPARGAMKGSGHKYEAPHRSSH